MNTEYRWKIFIANLNSVVDSEQAGRRPVLVISREVVNRNIPVICVLPFASFKIGRKIYPTEMLLRKEFTSLSKDSILLFHQIRTISRGRLERVCGFIENEEIREKIKNKLQFYFDI
ncbi:MAG: type II toxin-antitoxin system PemK/MazF family toxin [Actinomycetota bacterium]|nr:type II toxin-antitoxin system PemK/MazF family toxin [Actinomycetota bacterium]